MSLWKASLTGLALAIFIISPASAVVLAAGSAVAAPQSHVQLGLQMYPGGNGPGGRGSGGGGSPPSRFTCPTISGADSSVCSTNWSGYAVTGSTGSVSAVSGSWTVPTVSCPSRGTTYAAFWVGIDGYSDSTVEQTGIFAECNNGAATYEAWYEFYPAASVAISGVTVAPGDKITASVTYSTTTGEFTTTISSSGGGSYSTSSAVSGADRSSAEWVVERPEVCSFSCSLTTLADFGTGSLGSDYTGVASTNYATVNGVTGPISSFTTAAITMVSGSQGPVLAQPTSLSSDGTSFQVDYS